MSEYEARFGRMLLMAAASMGVIVAALMWVPRRVQAQGAPSFDAATVRPSDPNETRGRLGIEGDRLVVGNQTLPEILSFAYGLNSQDKRIFGGPEWMGSAKFDIDAKMNGAFMDGAQKLPPEQRIGQVRAMLLQLFAERFKLKAHHEMRELPVYELIVARGGAKLKPSVGEVKLSEQGLTSTGGHVEGRKAKVGMLADLLGFQVETGGRKVVDKTGLAGEYDFSLGWTRQGPDGVAPADAPLPSLFTALQEQLGLRLQLTKATVDTIAIDHIERPSEN